MHCYYVRKVFNCKFTAHGARVEHFFVGGGGGQILPFSELFLKVSLVYWLFPLVVRRL